MKVCRECGIEKDLESFYKHSAMLDGHLNKCIDCVKSIVKKHRDANIEKIRAYDKKRGKFPHRLDAVKKYSKTKKGKEVKKKSQINYRKKYPMKYAAHVLTRNAIRDGKLIRQLNCSVCNSTNIVEGHHDDYTKPLEVRWLCKACHKEWHRHNKPIYE